MTDDDMLRRAREAALSHSPNRHLRSVQEGYRDGRFDDDHAVQAALAALRVAFD